LILAARLTFAGNAGFGGFSRFSDFGIPLDMFGGILIRQRLPITMFRVIRI